MTTPSPTPAHHGDEDASPCIWLLSLQESPSPSLPQFVGAWQTMNPAMTVRVVDFENVGALLGNHPVFEQEADTVDEQYAVIAYLLVARYGGFAATWMTKPLRPLCDLPTDGSPHAIIATTTDMAWQTTPELLDDVQADSPGIVVLGGTPGSPFWAFVENRLREHAAPGGAWSFVNPCHRHKARFNARSGTDFLGGCIRDFCGNAALRQQDTRRPMFVNGVLLLPERAFPEVSETHWRHAYSFPEGAYACRVVSGMSPGEAEALKNGVKDVGRCTCWK